LTGRENVFLNGAILGMSRAEIRKKFDEIVAFAEVEKFLDTPVKRYSSGMYVRLAFAVAAHLEPEILIVDEVLAVGDASYPTKWLGGSVNSLPLPLTRGISLRLRRRWNSSPPLT
jgi:lipopolysaccharide transport system ATP-binding protein